MNLSNERIVNRKSKYQNLKTLELFLNQLVQQKIHIYPKPEEF